MSTPEPRAQWPTPTRYRPKKDLSRRQHKVALVILFVGLITFAVVSSFVFLHLLARLADEFFGPN